MKELLNEWAKLQRQIDELKSKQVEIELQVKPFVLENKATIEGDGVKAAYSNGRGSYDYKSAGGNAPEELIQKHTVSKVDWRKVCKDADIQGDALKAHYRVGKPSVSIKLI